MAAQGLACAAFALIAVVVFIPLIRIGASRLGLFDRTGPLKIHSGEIPRLGGVAIFLGILLAFLGRPQPRPEFYLAAGVLWLVGIADDLYDVRPLLRLVVQVGVACLLFYSGYKFPISNQLLSLCANIAIIVLFVNAFNMLDGMDGLATGVTAVIAIGYFSLGHHDPLTVTVAAGLFGACVGFLFFNSHPASIFMGDSGSTILGFLAAFLGLNINRFNTDTSPLVLAPFLFAALPIADACLAILRRLLRGTSPFVGDREHTYDLLSQCGWPVRRIALLWYGITALMVLAGIISARSGWTVAIGIATAVLCLALLFSRLLDAAVRENQSPQPEPTMYRIADTKS